MYRIAEDTELIKRARRVCSQDMKKFEKIMHNEYGVSGQISLVGSAERKLITVNGNNNRFDFDYNFTVVDGMEYDPSWLRDKCRLGFNKVMREAGLEDVDNSTSVLTSKDMAFNNDPTDTYFKIDLCIVTVKDGFLNRLIWDKYMGRMIWNMVTNNESFKNKESKVKNKYRDEIAETYVNKKNLYINDKERHPSFNCYVEAVNEVYGKHVR